MMRYCCEYPYYYLLLLLLFLSYGSNAFELKIKEHDEECFTIVTPEWTNDDDTTNHHPTHFLTAHYELLSNSFKEGLHVFVTDQHDNDLFNTHGNVVDRFQVELSPSTKYFVCLENTGYREQQQQQQQQQADDDYYDITQSSMIVGVNFVIRSKRTTGGRNMQDQADGWFDKADEVVSFLQDLDDYLGHMKMREGTHRDLVERTFTAILWWTLGELIMVSSLAGGQILYFRRFLERKARF